MNHARAQAAINELFVGRGKRLPELRSHLEGCGDCRAIYDRTALAFRSIQGRPDEMTGEELSLFAPPFPSPAPVRARWPMLWLGGLATAAAAALVVYVQVEPQEFNARGSTPVATHSVTRALCSRGTGSAVVVADAADCANGDRLSFATTGRGQRYVAVALVDQRDELELVVAGPEGKLVAGEEVILPSSSTFRPGVRAVAIYGNAPIGPGDASKCVKETCPVTLERRDIALGKPAP